MGHTVRTADDGRSALDIVHRSGPAALSFATLAARVGLASSTIVQRFGSKPTLLRAALLRAREIAVEEAGRGVAHETTQFERARADGLAITADMYPYEAGATGLSSCFPPWAHEGGRAKMLERLRDPATREKMKQNIRNGIAGWYNHYTAVGGDWSRMLVSDRNKYKGMTMDNVIAELSKSRTPTPEPLDLPPPPPASRARPARARPRDRLRHQRRRRHRARAASRRQRRHRQRLPRLLLRRSDLRQPAAARGDVPVADLLRQGMPRYAAGLEYDGRAYSGWQFQPGLQTVQDVVQRALSRVADAPVEEAVDLIIGGIFFSTSPPLMGMLVSPI